MKKITILACFIFLLTIVSAAGNLGSDFECEYQYIYDEIMDTENKVLIFDNVIGELNVKFWEHCINGVHIINNSILMHTSLEKNDIEHYENRWDTVDYSSFYSINKSFEPENSYFWKKLIAFLDEKDITNFYSITTSIEFPIICWEVRYTDGTTKIFDLNATQIGKGIPAPSERGFSLNGYDHDVGPNCWRSWRLSADRYFSKWFNSTVSLASPFVYDISKNVKDPDTTFFYELAHGGSNSFRANAVEWYYSSKTKVDMAQRGPMTFAFIGSCGGMDSTGPGSFSYEFRKGQMTDTVTVGYVGMEHSSGWGYSLWWQEHMFEKMDKGFTIKEAFSSASAYYPQISRNVKFKGDENLKITSHVPNTPAITSGMPIGIPNEEYIYSANTTDFDGDNISYLFDWGDGTDSGWQGPFTSGKEISLSHSWEKGTYQIKVKARDSDDLESDWSKPFQVSISNPPNTPAKPSGFRHIKENYSYGYATCSSDIDGDKIYYFWDWGDGFNSSWIGPFDSGEKIMTSHSWVGAGSYTIRVKAKDEHGLESDWSTLEVSMPKNKAINLPFLHFLENHPRMFPLLRLLLNLPEIQ